MDSAGSGALLYHGGNLSVARRTWPAAPRPWIDLSTGINPVPYPLPDIPAAAWTRLPEPAETLALEAAAARAWGADPDTVVAAPGTQALLQALPRLVPARRVSVLGFTYAEHARTWQRQGGATVETVDTLDALAAADVGVVVNPNNPDGRRIAAEDLRALAHEMNRRGGLLVVDEAFADVLPASASLASHVAACGAVVLRSFGKTYGLAGIRLGFLVAPEPFARAVREELGPWAVGGPAIHVGRMALDDRAWLAATIARLNRAADRLDRLLARGGLVIHGGTPLFRLAAARAGPTIFGRLAERGVLVRAFAGRPEWLRFGLPGPAQWETLEERLRQVLPMEPAPGGG